MKKRPDCKIRDAFHIIGHVSTKTKLLVILFA